MLVTDLVTRYLEHCAITGVHCPESTSERQRTLHAFIADFGTSEVAALKPYMLTDWIEKRPRWRSTSTRKAKCNQVNAVFNWAAREGRISRNPFAGTSYAEADPRPAMPDAVLGEILLRANKRFERAIKFLRLTGCRLSEMARIRWDDCDLVRGVVTLAAHKSRKKTGKPRFIVLTKDAVELLSEVRRDQEGEAQSDVVFLNNRGAAWTRRTLGQQLRRLKSRYGLNTNATLHGLRHAAASAAIQAGVPIKAVSLMLGHASTAITEKFYCHLDDAAEGMARQAAEAARPR